MPGTRLGAAKAVMTTKQRHGEDHFQLIGSIGGQARVPKGFALMDPEVVRAAGIKGGKKSKRPKALA